MELNKIKTIFLIRHGEIDNPKHIVGLNDSLNGVGIIQSELVAKKLNDKSITKIYTSPILRAKQTAEIIAKKLNIEMIILPKFGERNWGNWTSHKWVEIENKLKNMSFDKRYIFIPPGGESWKQMEHRLVTTFNNIVNNLQGNFAIVLHAGVLRALVPILQGVARKKSFSYDFKNASITSFDCDGDKYKLDLFNSVEHLNE